ncbi:MAG TPA: DUF4136 domain-containing protein [Cellvibrionaceae bacterium]
MFYSHSARCRTLLATLALMLFTTGCATSGPQVLSDYDSSVDFGTYRTFAFVEPLGTDRSGYSTLITAHFKAAARTEMEALGYSYSESNPDLLVNFFSNTENRTDVRSRPTVSTGFGYYGYRSSLYFGLPLFQSQTNTRHYKVGTLNIDVVDAEREQLIWEGMMEGRLSKEDMENPRAAIAEAIKEIFKHYPLKQQ